MSNMQEQKIQNGIRILAASMALRSNNGLDNFLTFGITESKGGIGRMIASNVGYFHHILESAGLAQLAIRPDGMKLLKSYNPLAQKLSVSESGALEVLQGTLRQSETIAWDSVLVELTSQAKQARLQFLAFSAQIGDDEDSEFTLIAQEAKDSFVNVQGLILEYVALNFILPLDHMQRASLSAIRTATTVRMGGNDDTVLNLDRITLQRESGVDSPFDSVIAEYALFA